MNNGVLIVIVILVVLVVGVNGALFLSLRRGGTQPFRPGVLQRAQPLAAGGREPREIVQAGFRT